MNCRGYAASDKLPSESIKTIGGLVMASFLRSSPGSLVLTELGYSSIARSLQWMEEEKGEETLYNIVEETATTALDKCTQQNKGMPEYLQEFHYLISTNNEPSRLRDLLNQEPIAKIREEDIEASFMSFKKYNYLLGVHCYQQMKTKGTLS